MQKTLVTIGIPTSSHVIFEFALSLARLSAYYSPNYQLDSISYAQGCLVHANRNKIVTNFLSSNSEWLLQIDTDMVFNSDLIDKLLLLASKKEAKIVSGWAMNIIKGKYVPVIYQRNGDRYKHILPTANQYISVDAVGTACIMIHRTVFEKLKNTSQNWFYFDNYNEELIGEDLVFCNNARLANYEIWIDTNLKLKHMKLNEI